MIALQGCGSSGETYTKRCMDRQGNILPDSSCSRTGVGGYPMWIYTGGMTRWNGNRVVGGYSPTQPPNATIKSSNGTVLSRPARGGFGTSGRGFSTGA